jgi:hypothetical protein
MLTRLPVLQALHIQPSTRMVAAMNIYIIIIILYTNIL